MQLKEPPFIKCIQTDFMLLHTDLWLMSDDKSLLKLVDMHLLKGDDKKTDISFRGIRFLRADATSLRQTAFPRSIDRGRTLEIGLNCSTFHRQKLLCKNSFY